MAATDSHETGAANTEWTVQLTMRVPAGDDGTLTDSATQRLERRSDLAAVEVDSLSGLSPGLSATEAVLELSVETARELSRRSLEETLMAAPGTEAVDSVEPG